VVFRVAGTIVLQSHLIVRNPYLTVAGQTAPGGGILISGKKLKVDMLQFRTHDIVWEYTRIRKGFATGGNDRAATIQMIDASNIMFSHNSLSWNQDEGMGVWGFAADRTKDISLSWNLVAEGIDPHATGALTGSDKASVAASMTDIDMDHNMEMNNTHRNPLMKHKSARYVNNIDYNNSFYMSQFIGGISADVIGNIYKRGPMTGTRRGDTHEVEASAASATDAADGSPSLYLAGNKGWHQTDSSGDQWLLVRKIAGENGAEVGDVPAAWKRSVPLASQTYPIIAESVSTLEATMLPIVGASRRLDENGNWVLNRDCVDARLINQYQTDTGIAAAITNESQVGGFPVIAGGAAYPDSDHDGMPDAWELAHGLDPNNAADGHLYATNGYTNVENFLRGANDE